MRYNKITIDGIEGYYAFNPIGEIIGYYSLDGKEITLNGSEEIIVIQADYVL